MTDIDMNTTTDGRDMDGEVTVAVPDGTNPGGTPGMQPGEDQIEGTPHKGRRTWWLIGAGIMIAVLVAILVVVITAGDGSDAAGLASLSTATVERRDLVSSDTLSGTLGYGDADPVILASSSDGVTTITGGASGTVTSIATVGTTVRSGDVLYAVDAKPVALLEGSIPAYRAFNSRMTDGPDVEQLERALVALGFDPDDDITVDDDFTSSTADAIVLFQASIGAEETGSLPLGDVIFSEQPIYVAESIVGVGAIVRSGDAIVATSRPVEGTVTAIVDEGVVVDEGSVLLEVDDEPVVLLVGDLPFYRSLSIGSAGDDVAQLESALANLGFGDGDGFDIDGVFDEATLVAVRDWQSSTGASPDGVVNMGDVVVLPTPIRVGETLVSVGDTVHDGTSVFTSSASTTIVTVQLSTDDQDIVSVGDQVVVELPSGATEPAHVSEIGTVVLATQQGATYFEMKVTLDDPGSATGLDEAPVDIEVVGERAEDVLVVPVTALVALVEGGYAVEVAADDGSTYLVAVDPGLFADGYVEVASSGLDAGMRVVVP